MAKEERKGQNNPRQTREKLIDVGIDLFSRKGFAGTSIRDIAAEVGMTTSNIYHYFGTKRGLLSAIEQQTLEPILQEFRRIASLDLPPLERFTLLIRTHITFMDSHRKESKIFSLSEENLPRNKKFQAETFYIYRSEIDRLLSSMGKKGDATILAFNTFGVIVWFVRWYRPEGRKSLEEVINAITEYILNGIIGKVPDTVRATMGRL